MTDHKFTDEEIVKALECCTNCICNHAKTDTECPLVPMSFCKNYLMKQSLALINRQKAEIERLQAVHADMTESLRLASEANKDMQTEIKRLKDKYECIYQPKAMIKAEAIKEFAQRLKKRARMPLGTLYGGMVYLKDIDNLVKIMTEDNNGNNT